MVYVIFSVIHYNTTFNFILQNAPTPTHLSISATMPSSEDEFNTYNQDQKTAITGCIMNETTQTSIFNVPISDFKLFMFAFLFQIACACFKSQA